MYNFGIPIEIEKTNNKKILKHFSTVWAWQFMAVLGLFLLCACQTSRGF